METPSQSARPGRGSRLFSLALAVPMLLGTLAWAPSPAANAATSAVTIKAIGTKTTPYKGKYTIKPSYSATGQVRVTKATLTVKKGTKTIANRVSSIKLAAGKYSLTQEVTYQPYSYQTTQQTVVAAGTWLGAYYSPQFDVFDCTITASTAQDATQGTWNASCTVRDEYASSEIGTVDTAGTWVADGDDVLWQNSRSETLNIADSAPSVEDSFLPNDEIQALTAITKPVQTKVYGAAATVTGTQALTVKAGKKDCATYADYKKVKPVKKIGRGDSLKTVAKKLFSKGARYDSEEVSGHTVEVRVYKGCTHGKAAAVGYVDGHAFNKAYGSE